MGAYRDKRWCVYRAWKQVARKRQKLILGPQYREAPPEECIEKNH